MLREVGGGATIYGSTPANQFAHTNSVSGDFGTIGGSARFVTSGVGLTVDGPVSATSTIYLFWKRVDRPRTLFA